MQWWQEVRYILFIASAIRKYNKLLATTVALEESFQSQKQLYIHKFPFFSLSVSHRNPSTA